MQVMPMLAIADEFFAKLNKWRADALDYSPANMRKMMTASSKFINGMMLIKLIVQNPWHPNLTRPQLRDMVKMALTTARDTDPPSLKMCNLFAGTATFFRTGTDSPLVTFTKIASGLVTRDASLRAKIEETIKSSDGKLTFPEVFILAISYYQFLARDTIIHHTMLLIKNEDDFTPSQRRELEALAVAMAEDPNVSPLLERDALAQVSEELHVVNGLPEGSRDTIIRYAKLLIHFPDTRTENRAYFTSLVSNLSGQPILGADALGSVCENAQVMKNVPVGYDRQIIRCVALCFAFGDVMAGGSGQRQFLALADKLTGDQRRGPHAAMLAGDLVLGPNGALLGGRDAFNAIFSIFEKHAVCKCDCQK